MALPGRHSPIANGTVTSATSASKSTRVPSPIKSSTATHVPTTAHYTNTTITSARGSSTATAGESGSVSTITSTITLTTFEPCSTPVTTRDGTTYYSTWLTTSVYETTTCYTTTYNPRTATHTAAATNAHVTAHPGVSVPSNCPSPETVTKTETVTVGGNGDGSLPTVHPGKPCARCETITYTNTYGHTKTIVIPVEPTGNSGHLTESTGGDNDHSSTKSTTKTLSTAKPTFTHTRHGNGTHTSHTKWTSSPVPTRSVHPSIHSSIQSSATPLSRRAMWRPIY
ncbi:hypothetical protein EYZ11_005425 [Aspergillus tanneri]|uniref:Uncharacterized protein n=1 Tax=Aspergillus tanneri TaxID=1220188 RepID=A0A4S3JNZ0_9EURO|nr:uncharacterized protein ATNIH1004_010622 [Aspergillus tanneri]KAA8643847.1 hypothetical protein ATNIH1004_010622 [Aspergillus tanneri]THC95101.1 hypothetical protein EYZ11_005425 [Aspergillus tanneri]